MARAKLLFRAGFSLCDKCHNKRREKALRQERLCLYIKGNLKQAEIVLPVDPGNVMFSKVVR